METRQIIVEAQEIVGSPGLDPIRVFWQDVGPGQGYVTICCYGQAWTTYFGGMGSDRTIRQFFADCGSDYMLTKLGYAPHLKRGKRDYVYLTRIIEAVRASLVAEQGVDKA